MVHLMLEVLAMTAALLLGFGILVFQLRLVKRILNAVTDVNQFNQSLALCLAASGGNLRKIFVKKMVYEIW